MFFVINKEIKMIIVLSNCKILSILWKETADLGLVTRQYQLSCWTRVSRERQYRGDAGLG